MTYYVSSKLKHRRLWLESGIETTSSWLLSEEKLDDDANFTVMWNAYRDEVDAADGFVMYLEYGDTPKGALIEMGMAFDAGLPIYIMWHGNKRELRDILGTIVYHDSVTIIKDLKELP